jgi:hypothetical protein
MEIKFTDDEKAQLLRVAPSSCQKGRVTIRLCPVCGTPDWSCTESNKPDELNIQIYNGECSRCQNAYMRAPEVVNWVMAVMDFYDRKRRNAG